MMIRIEPFLRNRNLTLVFLGQFISFFGSTMTSVVVPVQVYQATQSTFLVGMIGLTQLIPVLLFGLWGGALADQLDRRKMIIVTEMVMIVGVAFLLLNSWGHQPHIWVVFLVSFLVQSAGTFHRPALDGLMQAIIAPKDYATMAAWGSLRFSVGIIGGSALGGWIATSYGSPVAYGVDLATYGVSLLCLLALKNIPAQTKSEKPSLLSIREGIGFARKRPVLLGTYFVDMVSMGFAYPVAVFPAIAAGLHDDRLAGFLYAAPAVGAGLISLTSSWSAKVKRAGRAVAFGATGWGICVALAGWSDDIRVTLFFLALAGACDAVSGIFRSVIWNNVIPNVMRGRLASVEMMSYLSGPMGGNAIMGFAASIWGPLRSMAVGGVFSAGGSLGLSLWIRDFWKFELKSHDSP